MKTWWVRDNVKRAAAAAVAAILLAACAQDTPESLIQAGERSLAERDYRAAQIAFRNAIRLAPASGRGHRLLGEAFLKGGDAQAAEATLRKALDLAEPRDAVVPLLAQALLRRGQPLRVIDELSTVTLSDAQANASLLTSVATALLSRGAVDKAEAAFAAALVSSPGHAPARLGQARMAAAAGRTDVALGIVDGVLTAQPGELEGHVLRAQIVLARGDRAAAIAALESALAIDEADLTARSALVSIHVDAKEFDRAQAWLDKANVRTTDEPPMMFLRSLVAMHRGDLPKAKELINALLAKLPNHVPSLSLAAQIDLRSGDLNSAERLLQRALRSDPSAALPRRLLVATSIRQGHPGRAVDALQPLLGDPGTLDAGTKLLAGEAYLASGDLARAMEFFDSAKSDPKGQSIAQARLGQLSMLRGDVAQGVGELQSLVGIGGQPQNADLLLAAVHLRRQEPGPALEVADRLAQRDPRNPLGHTLAGRARLLQKNYPEARSRFNASLAIQHDYVPALRGLADVDLQQGRPADAVQRLEAAARANGNDEQLLIALADVQARVGEPAKALVTLRAAVGVNRQSIGAQTALVQFLIAQHQLGPAVVAARDAVNSNPMNARLIELLGLTLEVSGAQEDAIKSFRELARLDPRAPVPWLKLAAAQTRANDYRSAAQSLRQARQAVPDNESVAKDLVAVLLADKKTADAMSVAKDMQSRRPASAIGHALEGDVQASVYRWVDAERAYRQALRLETDSGPSALSLCRMLVSARRKAEATRCIDDWIARHPDDLTMREYAGESAALAHDHRTAAKHFGTIATQAPFSALALSRHAQALGKLKDSTAFDIAARALALAPNHPDVLDTMGTLHVEFGDAVRGLDYLSRARSLSPKRATYRLHYAMGLLKTGRRAEANRELNELWNSGEDFPGRSGIPALLKSM